MSLNSKIQFRDKSENLRKMNNFEKFNEDKIKSFAENAKFFD